MQTDKIFQYKSYLFLLKLILCIIPATVQQVELKLTILLQIRKHYVSKNNGELYRSAENQNRSF